MSEPTLAADASPDTQTTPWAPSANLRWWLLIGFWAVAVDVCLSAASVSIDLARTKEPQGFTITDGLDWAVILPHIVVLLAFLALAREALSISLWRSSIGVFGSMWLLAVWSVMPSSEAEGFGPWEALATVTLVIGIICIFVLISRRPAAFRQPAAGESPSQERAAKEPESNEPTANQPEKPRSEKSKWGCLSIVLAFVAARLLHKLFRHTGLGRGQVEAIATIVIPCCVLLAPPVFLVWFGISKIRLRHKLGSMAAVSGWADLVSATLGLAAFVFIAVATVQAALREQELDWYEPTLRIPTTVESVYDLVWKALFAALFLSVRGHVVRTERLVPGGV